MGETCYSSECRSMRVLRAYACAVLLTCAGCANATLWLDRPDDAAVPPSAATSQSSGFVPGDPAAGQTAVESGAPPSAAVQAPTDPAVLPPSAAAAPDHSQPHAGEPATPIQTVAQPPNPPPTAAGETNDADAGLEPPRPTRLPQVAGTCPTLNKSGRYTFSDATGQSLSAQIYIAPDAAHKPGPGGPLILYWHAFGAQANEVMNGFGQAAIDEVVAEGGVVAAFESTACVRCLIDEQELEWHTQDEPVSDQVVACALQQAKIDTRHIHSIGFSAGAMHSVRLAIDRSNYIASVVSYSGGLGPEPTTMQDPSNRVAALLSYGDPALDNAVVSFAGQSITWYDHAESRGAYAMMCDHRQGHVIPADVVTQTLRFLRDHPYKVEPEPYATKIPSVFPTYCQNAPPRR